jgi:hypothetical protein
MYLVYAIAIALAAGLVGAVIGGLLRKRMPRPGEIRER